jgi:hypothetical protein
MARLFTASQLRRLVFVWTAVFAMLTLLLPLFCVITTPTVAWVLPVNACALMGIATYRLLVRPGGSGYRALFRTLSVSAALVFGLIALNPFLSF